MLDEGFEREMSVKSPCVYVCKINADLEICEGCGRKLHEIASWVRYSPEEREEIMADLSTRLAQLKPVESEQCED